MRRLTFAVTLASALGMVAAETPYEVSFKAGIIPAGVSVANNNALLPNADGYKRGWTDIGWTVDRYGARGYVALSPTYTVTVDSDGKTGPVSPSENVLTLPLLTIKDGDFLKWDALSMHPDFPEAYRVEIEADGSKVILFSTDAEDAQWVTRVADLSEYAGKEVSISFICVSTNRYILALDAISVGAPQGISLQSRDDTPIYYGPETSAPVTIEALNTGASLSGGSLVLTVDYEDVQTVAIESVWNTGENRSFGFTAPLELNRRTEYDVYYVAPDNTDRILLSRKTLYSSNFKKKLVVDKGTGMWCVNCPEGILSIESLERQFGESLIMLDTHITSGSASSDILANPSYFDGLGFNSVPWMKLNRIRNSASSSPQLFYNFYYRQVMFNLGITGLELQGNGSASVTVTVEASEQTDNSDGRYRVGYMLTSDFRNPDNNAHYFQRNGCNQVSSDRFYYLPARIPAPLCTFRHVTLTSDDAFTGIEGSLPTDITSRSGHTFTWSFDRPEAVADINDIRIVAYVLDTQTGEIMAADALKVADAEVSGIPDTVADTTGRTITVSADGCVNLTFDTPTDYTLDVYSVSGARCMTLHGTPAYSASHHLGLKRGMYVITLTAGGQTMSRKAIF